MHSYTTINVLIPHSYIYEPTFYIDLLMTYVLIYIINYNIESTNTV